MNKYQANVYERLSPYLTEEEREWLRSETAAI
jgi:23S rRNA maturation mini-RNase III